MVRPILAMCIGAMLARSAVAWACLCSPPHREGALEFVSATIDGVDVPLADVPEAWGERGALELHGRSGGFVGDLDAGDVLVTFNGETP